MTDIKVDKDKYSSRWVDRKNVYVKRNSIKDCAQRRRWWLMEEKEVQDWMDWASWKHK